MADRAAMSQAHFSRAFKRAFGATPHQYLLRRRLEHAAWLLRTTDLTVTAVCLEVGLTSPTSFAAAFRRRKGMSPSAYRAAMPRHAPVDRLPLCWVTRVSTSGEDAGARRG